MHDLTRKSWIELRDRLVQREKQVRIDLADEIKHAASFGDFSENSELDAAREKQQILTLEVQRLREKLNQAEIIDDLKIDASRVSIGTSVTLYDHEQKEEIKWTILGADDSNPSAGVIFMFVWQSKRGRHPAAGSVAGHRRLAGPTTKSPTTKDPGPSAGPDADWLRKYSCLCASTGAQRRGSPSFRFLFRLRSTIDRYAARPYGARQPKQGES